MVKKAMHLLLIIMIFLPAWHIESVQSQSDSVEHLIPAPGSKYNPPGTAIAVRYGPQLDSGSINNKLFSVSGSSSGTHSGKVVLTGDQKTVIFQSDRSFKRGEVVQVDIHPGAVSVSGETFSYVSYSFSISYTNPASPQAVSAINDLMLDELAPAANEEVEMQAAENKYVTAPPDFPNIMVTTPAGDVGEGYIFASVFTGGTSVPPVRPFYMLMLDNQGEPVYYVRAPGNVRLNDFKVLPNGHLTYWRAGKYYILDNQYNIIHTVSAGNGYNNIDQHDLILLPNGNYMFMIYDLVTVNMEEIVTGGDPNATVIDLVIQEVDPDGNVVFQWSALDEGNIPITDSNQNLTASRIDYVHGNAIEYDEDDDAVLLSSRHLDEITKIDLSTGEIIWRLGGKQNDFDITAADGIDEDPNFYVQHDIRLLENGNITIFDNHSTVDPRNTRVLEYILDEDNLTAELVWVYRNNPDVNSGFMGNAQTLPNGNKFIGWGGVSNPNITEITSDGTKVFEIGFESPYINYRAFRFPWQGFPQWVPDLVVKNSGGVVDLYFSWNGATEIASYEVYGGETSDDLSLITEVDRTGFETSIRLDGEQANLCYYQVMPIDLEDQETILSEVVTNPACVLLMQYFPILRNITD